MKSTFVTKLLISALLFTSTCAFAQAGNRPTGQRPQWQRETAEQRQQQSEARLRDVMSSSGLTASADQDAVLAFLRGELEARKPLRALGMKLQEALANPSSTDDQIKAMMDDYKNAQAVERQHRADAQKALDAQIHYTKNPRIEAMLMLMGVLGNGQPLMQNPRRPGEFNRGPRGRGDAGERPRNRPNRPQPDRGNQPQQDESMDD